MKLRKIKNNTNVKIEINKNDHTLSGIFYQKSEEELKNNNITKNEFENIIEIYKRVMKQ